MNKTCNNCGDFKMSIPYAAHEADMSRAERSNKRLWIVALVLIATLVASNLAWVIYEAQFETVEETTVTQDNENGDNNYIGNDGDINYGQTGNN